MQERQTMKTKKQTKTDTTTTAPQTAPQGIPSPRAIMYRVTSLIAAAAIAKNAGRDDTLGEIRSEIDAATRTYWKHHARA
jgi:hypothetical protein